MSNPRLGYSRGTFLPVVILTSVVFVLSSCGLLDEDVPPPGSSPITGIETGNPGYHVVKGGDTLSTIARQYGLSMSEVAAANDLEPPYTLAVGQFLILPRPATYEVRKGDNLYRIARAHGVAMESLASANGIFPPYTIYPGQRLVVPETAAAPLEQTAALLPPRQGSGSPQTVPTIPPADVKRKDLPEIVTVPVTRSATNAPRQLTPASAPASAPGPAPPSAATKLPPPPAALLSPPPQSQRQAATAADPPPLARGGFLWPVRGEVISKFGPNPGGLHNDGINIAAPRGTPVVAAQSGVVIYAGNEIEGFGQLLIVKHADGWSTAYGHNDVLLVRQGDEVARGEAIARVGSTGDVTSPQLHFEIRRAAKAVDPADHLG